MNKLTKKIKGLLIALAVIVLLLGGTITYIVGGMVYEETVGYVDENYQNTSIEEVYADSPEIVARLDEYEVADLRIPSTNGYDIEAKWISSPQESQNTVVIVHGIGMNMWRHFRETLMCYRQVLLDEFWQIIFPIPRREIACVPGDSFFHAL